VRAVKEFQDALALNPEYVEAHLNLGLALERQQQLDAAIAQFRVAVKLRPDLAEAHNDLGLALLANGSATEAIEELRQSVTMKPEYAEAHYNLGLALREAHQPDAARVEFARARRLNARLPAP
jgi:Tfp pilus assembly protein PilF